MTNYVVVLVCAHVVATVSLGALCAGAVLAAWMATPADADLRHDVTLALKRADWPTDAAAMQVGLSRQRFSRQLNGHEPITFLDRALTRVTGFEREFLALRAQRAQLLVVERGELADAVTALRALVMAKADLKARA